MPASRASWHNHGTPGADRLAQFAAAKGVPPWAHAEATIPSGRPWLPLSPGGWRSFCCGKACTTRAAQSWRWYEQLHATYMISMTGLHQRHCLKAVCYGTGPSSRRESKYEPCTTPGSRLPHAELQLVDRHFPVLPGSDRLESDIFPDRIRHRFGNGTAGQPCSAVSYAALSTLDVVSECGVFPLLVIGDGECAGLWLQAAQPLRRLGLRVKVLQVQIPTQLSRYCCFCSVHHREAGLTLTDSLVPVAIWYS